MSNVKTRLLHLNPELFSMRQPSKEHEIIVVGRKEKEKEGNNFKIIYDLRSKPNAAATAAKVLPQSFIHAAFKPVGTILIDEDGKRSFKGPKKARSGVVFQNTQPDLYHFLRQCLYDNDGMGKELLPEGDTYKKAGMDAQKRPCVKLRDTMWGLKVTFNCDLYTPHTMTPEGKSEPLMAVTFDPATGRYLKKKVVVGSYQFFADEDDLDNLLEVCARHYQKNVFPYVTEKVTTTTEKAGKVVTEIKEEEITGMEDYIIDADGNAVDENGDIVKTAEELGEMGLSPNEGDTVKLKVAS